MAKKKSFKIKTKTFKPGQVVIFEPKNFNQKYWNSLSERARIKYYGALGYGKKNKVQKLFVFLCQIHDTDGDTGHCVLASLDDQRIETMRHPEEFRLATNDEF